MSRTSRATPSAWPPRAAIRSAGATPRWASLRSVPWVALLATAWASGSCTAILAPRDSVQRCGSVDDCEETGDNRYVPECRFPEGSDLDPTEVDQVCVAIDAPTRCSPSFYPEDSALQMAIDDPATALARCPTDGPAPRGCPERYEEGCADGLLPRNDGICDLEDPDVPAYALNALEMGDEEQHVLDAFCQSFFCDETFVCNTDTNYCVRCDPDLPLTAGGCGRFYTDGEPACIYADDLEDECDGPDAEADEPLFGTCD